LAHLFLFFLFFSLSSQQAIDSASSGYVTNEVSFSFDALDSPSAPEAATLRVDTDILEDPGWGSAFGDSSKESNRYEEEPSPSISSYQESPTQRESPIREQRHSLDVERPKQQDYYYKNPPNRMQPPSVGTQESRQPRAASKPGSLPSSQSAPLPRVEAALPASSVNSSGMKAGANSGFIVHDVKLSETLEGIALQYGIQVCCCPSKNRWLGM
jgi:hypothetical protein